MKRIVSILGALFGVCCVVLGLLMVTGNINFASKSSSVVYSKGTSTALTRSWYGGDIYTELSKDLVTINDSVIAVNDNLKNGLDAIMKNEIEAAYSTNKTIYCMFGLLEITLGGFIFIFFLMNIFAIPVKIKEPKLGKNKRVVETNVSEEIKEEVLDENVEPSQE